MLSKGIMVLALLALVYLLLITMNNKPTEHFKPMKFSPGPANNSVVPAKPMNVAPVVAKAKPAPVQAPVAVKSKYIAPVTEYFAQESVQENVQEPVINYEENFEEGDELADVMDETRQLMIDDELAREYQIQYTNNFFQDSKKGKNIKNPSLDIRGEGVIAFDPTFTPFNSSSIAGEPLRDVRLLQGDIDGDCTVNEYNIEGNRVVRA